ncbi:MAG TPA: hypothetical protein VEG34_13615 [Thermoanaerobaculia bacterium]|nr:hypothetical protein [Thermoanaerobaculia bacterium]
MDTIRWAGTRTTAAGRAPRRTDAARRSETPRERNRQQESELTLADAELAALAARQAEVVAGVAAALEQALGRPE